MIWLALLSLICAAGPAALFLRNLRALRPPPMATSLGGTAILIPARDEETNIESAVRAGLASGAEVVIVLDDHSRDRTAVIVRQICAETPRVRLVRGETLPTDWRGKNFACAQLAVAARQPVLIFTDADVRLAPGAAARLEAFLEESGTQLASGIPRQETVTFSEQLLVPLIHFVLLAFLPLERMRASRHPAYATGCGQLFVAQADAYRESGGHGAIRGNVHDGLALPKKLRTAGFRTDLFDATEIATCRMYRSDREVWRGLAKNTMEGLGAPALIVPASLLLLLGQVAPFVLFILADSKTTVALAAAGSICVLLPRLLARLRFHQSFLSVLLHPFAILALVGIQWFGLARHLSGREARWKGRSLGSLGAGA